MSAPGISMSEDLKHYKDLKKSNLFYQLFKNSRHES